MICVRRGVFETNSSSSHSIVMMKRDNPSKTINDSNMVDSDWFVNDKGIMDFWYEQDLEFGRSPFELLTDWYGRLRYCIAAFGDDKTKLDELRDICIRRISGFVDFKFKEAWDCKTYTGYIDHQSMGILERALLEFKVSLEDFIFNDRYIIVIDGDEYNVFDTFVETDMFNDKAVEQIIPPM